MNSKIASCRTLLKSNRREKTSNVVTQRRPPLKYRRYSQAIVALRSLQFRYLPQCVVRVRDLTSLAVDLSSVVVDSDYQRNCDDHKTIRDGLARHENVKKMKVAVSNEIWTESQRIVLPSPNFQHAENLPTNTIISAVCSRYRIRQRQLTVTYDDWRQIKNCNSQLNLPCRYPLFVIVWARF